MNIKDLLGEFIVQAMAGFVTRLARNTETAKTNSHASRAATLLGSELANALISEGGDEPIQTVIRTEAAYPAPHPVFTEQQILDERMAIWNHPIDPPDRSR